MKKGFTLVELMLVVGIIAILAAIAIPNFTRFQARSKQSEVKTNMKALWVGEQSYYAERDRYTNETGQVAFAPERGNRYRYDLGDSVAGAQANALADNCATPQVRTAATVTLSGVECGIASDIYRYGTNIVPGSLNGRGVVTWKPSMAGSTPLPADGVGVDLAGCPTCSFSVRAVGNIDNDIGGDEFFMSSQFGSVPASPCAELLAGEHPGSPINTHNDINCEQ
jgi:type IV pilus assembly protein PilA